LSSLTDRLGAVSSPKRPAPIYDFLNGLSESDRETAWAAIRDKTAFGNYTLLRIFNEEGGRFGKESFNRFREAVISGDITEETVHGTR
jgi:hypothetical protein